MEKVIGINSIDVLDSSALVDENTGECFSADAGVKLKLYKEQGKSLMTYTDYVVLSNHSVLKLLNMIGSSDLGYVIFMSCLLQTSWGVLYNGNVPHTNKTLQAYLMIKSRPVYSLLMQRLVDLNILSKKKEYVVNRITTVYMMNPYLCRKRSVFNNEVFQYFKRL